MLIPAEYTISNNRTADTGAHATRIRKAHQETP